MNTSKLFCFFIYLIVLNIIAPCLSLKVISHSKDTYNNLRNRKYSKKIDLSLENNFSYNALKIIKNNITEIVLKAFNNIPVDEKKDLLKNQDDLKRFIHNIIDGKFTISTDQEKYATVVTIYELFKENFKLIVSDQKEMNTINHCFQMKKHYDKLIDAHWHNLLESMKEEFKNMRDLEDMTDDQKGALWNKWYIFLIKLKMEDELSQTRFFIDVMDQTDVELLIKIYLQSYEISWKNIREEYLMNEMHKFMTKEHNSILKKKLD
ncbi:hypothetical protein PRELSG_0023100 [Plasmodium relictum]|uniref:Plasmodium RESA N-terminal domain-containing protein n=1 Tax=Plasmodium relictum TaxID=85471 RepID=A0A1J1GK21_PLARL|nr:hypothetical protein PRELSG_0023100 [Plasmodium relictum]CRG84546.1 hypothetical protein PRELSG_0023100 [Plasmodium relictum]